MRRDINPDDIDFDQIDSDLPDDEDLAAIEDFDEQEAQRQHEEVMQLLQEIDEKIEAGFADIANAFSKLTAK